MKKLILSLLILGCASGLYAQSEKYMKAMETNVAAIDTVRSADGWANLSNNFQRIADAEKTQWLPYYYAALGQAMSGLMMGGGKAAKTDPIADKAEALINKAVSLGKENSEIWIVKKMISNVRMNADPMNRWQQYGAAGEEALGKAKSLDKENPRVYLLEGQDKFFTPEQFGGSKTAAKALFEQSMKKFETAKPESPIHPKWGLNQAKYFYDLSSK